MEDQSLQLGGHSLDVSWIVRRFDSAQEIPDCLIGGAHGSRIPGTGSADELMAGSIFDFRPSGPHGFAGAFTSLFGSEFSGSGGATLLPALAPQSNGGWILLPGWHN
jgi:hypothetical protein